jgi:TRAP-type C4-dicarboxylate transport system permease small subunit
MAIAILAVVLYDVVMRNAFDAPTIWALDVSRFLLVYLFFFALAPALQAGTHVSVDAVLHWVPPRIARHLRLLAITATILFGLILFWQVSRAALEAFIRDEMFPTAVRVPVKYVYWIAPVGTLQFVLTALVAFLHARQENEAG